jgi:DNA modification methylase
MEKEHDKKRCHPAQKPVALVDWFFEYFSLSKAVNLVDLYGGAGSTLIACEKTKRKCFMMELDEKYCDVIVKRWQEYTGKEATLESTGETFNSLI